MNVIISSYLTRGFDKQLNIQQKINDDVYVKNLVSSCNNTKTHCVILVDFDCYFKDSEFVSFKRFDYFCNDVIHFRRFKLYEKFIKETNYDNYLTCDCHDVIILRNPFVDVITNGYKIYVGSEKDIQMNNNIWVSSHFPLVGVDYNGYSKKRLLNCGIIGGSRDILIGFFKQYNNIINQLKNKHNLPSVIDMFSFNKIIYEYYSDAFVTGSPLHTVFKEYDLNNQTSCIAHK